MTDCSSHRDVSAAHSVVAPLTLWGGQDEIKLELKPYLQPFERDLAQRELLALVGPDTRIESENGYCRVGGKTSEKLLLERLTYWQRVGSDVLVPTRQTLLELSQNGVDAFTEAPARLHRARRLRYGVHGLHEYRGKFFPQLVRSLINVADVAPGGILLDPMCGSGTALCEAMALSCTALGVDLNPLSVFISRTKCAIVGCDGRSFADDVRGSVSAFEYQAIDPTDVWPNDLVYLTRWFSLRALEEVAAILAEIQLTDPLVRDFLLVCLSNVLRSISWQKDEDLRVRKEVQPYVKGSAAAQFESMVGEQVERIQAYLNFLPAETRDALSDVREGDSVSVDQVFKEFKGKVDVIVTSPPYATALPYLDTDRLSLIALGLLPRQEHKAREASMIGTREISERDRKYEWELFRQRQAELPASVVSMIEKIATHHHGDDVGFRRRNLPSLLGKYYLAMTDAMRSARRMMRPGGSAFYVVGNNSTTIDGERFEIPTDQFLWEIAQLVGWTPVETINMELLVSRDIFRNNRGSKETILWLRT